MNHSSHDSLPRLLFYLLMLAGLFLLLLMGACSIVLGHPAPNAPGYYQEPSIQHQEVRWYA